jgi:hypothetical protein
MDFVDKRKFSSPYRDSNPGNSSPYSGYYTNYVRKDLDLITDNIRHLVE